MVEPFEINIERLVYGGDGLGRLPDGRTIFVPFTIPGELVRARAADEKRGFVRGELVEVLQASDKRVVPRCVHFGYCGGCHYQHMDYSTQVQAKAAILGEQLERIAGLKDIPAVETVAASEPWYYRNNIQFHLTREGKLGFQKAHSNQTFDIRECHLPEPAINQTWPRLDIEPIAGLERVSLRVGLDEELMLILESTDTQPLDFDIQGLTISVVHETPAGNLVLAGSDHIFMEIAGRQFKVSSNAFFQVNTPQAHTMLQFLLKNLALNAERTVLDVYCGVGLFSAFLAPQVRELVGIELSTQACADFILNLDEFDNVSLYEASAEDVLNSVEFHPEVILVDPPREGLGGRTVQGILAQDARTLAYVSCDPATLARDAKHLTAGGYKLEKLTLVDMFPQTFHIESISLWEKDS